MDFFVVCDFGMEVTNSFVKAHFVFLKCLGCFLIRYEKLFGIGFRFSHFIPWMDQMVLVQLLKSSRAPNQSDTLRLLSKVFAPTNQ